MSDPALVNTELVLQRRFGVVTGLPQVYAVHGDHTIYTPQTKRHIRLKYIAIYSDPANAGSCLVTLKWGGTSGNIYLIPYPAGYGAYGHASVREGAADETLVINLSADVTIYVTALDVEEF